MSKQSPISLLVILRLDRGIQQLFRLLPWELDAPIKSEHDEEKDDPSESFSDSV